MKKINYITNLDVDKAGGGWSGMNHHVYNQLAKCYRITLIQNINPPVSLFHRLISKLLRSISFSGVIPAFTNSRLTTIRNKVMERFDHEAKFTFFHGATPWVHITPPGPYGLYLDACFETYIRIYHARQKFNSDQLSQIFQKERTFLKNAAAVFFSSFWALEQAKKAYALDGKNFHCAGLGGNIGVPQNVNTQKIEKVFLFVALDFIGKGGDKVSLAFTQFRKTFPEFRLSIIGEKPTPDVLALDGIEYLGYLDKKKPDHFEKLIHAFATSYCLILPTNKDATPLVLVEAGYYGCPSIAVNNFGIPEMVIDGKTGILIDAVPTVDAILEAMLKLCTKNDFYYSLRENTEVHYKNSFRWDRTGEFIINEIERILNKNYQSEMILKD